jgi:germination protein M
MTGRAILRFLPIALTLALVAGCGGSGKATATQTATTSAPATKPVKLYFLRDGKVAPVLRYLSSNDGPELLKALEAGPTAAERAIGFTSDMDAAPTSRTRLAQMVYTDTQWTPVGADTVGDRPYTRANFEDVTPAILVESPLPFQTVTNPLRVTGTANTFEATFQYELKDAAGKALAEHFVTATSGSGIRGTFDVTIPFTVPSRQNGTLTVYEVSAKDGSRVNQVDIPLTLAP